jgi:hypothetical protein
MNKTLGREGLSGVQTMNIYDEHEWALIDVQNLHRCSSMNTYENT